MNKATFDFEISRNTAIRILKNKDHLLNYFEVMAFDSNTSNWISIGSGTINNDKIPDNFTKFEVWSSQASTIHVEQLKSEYAKGHV